MSVSKMTTFGDGDQEIAGQNCYVAQISKPPAEELWTVYCFDDLARAFVNVCPEPQPIRDDAVRIADEYLSDPVRYSRLVLMAAQKLRNDAAANLSDKVRCLQDRVERIESKMSSLAIERAAVDSDGARM